MSKQKIPSHLLTVWDFFQISDIVDVKNNANIFITEEDVKAVYPDTTEKDQTQAFDCFDMYRKSEGMINTYLSSLRRSSKYLLFASFYKMYPNEDKYDQIEAGIKAVTDIFSLFIKDTERNLEIIQSIDAHMQRKLANFISKVGLYIEQNRDERENDAQVESYRTVQNVTRDSLSPLPYTIQEWSDFFSNFDRRRDQEAIRELTEMDNELLTDEQTENIMQSIGFARNTITGEWTTNDQDNQNEISDDG